MLPRVTFLVSLFTLDSFLKVMVLRYDNRRGAAASDQDLRSGDRLHG